MKHFKLMKGVLACLLSLALIIGSMGSTGLGFIATSASGESSESATSTSGGSGSSTSGNQTVTADVSATYDPNTDSVIFSSDEKVTVYYAVVGEKGKKLANGSNKSDFKTVELTAKKAAPTSTSGGSGDSTSGDSTSGNSTGSGDTTLGAYTAYVSFDKAEINMKANKDTYLFYTAETPSAEKTEYKHKLVIKGSEKVKLTVALNYYSIDDDTVSAIGYAKKVVKKESTDVSIANLIYRVGTVDKSVKGAKPVYSEWKSASELTGAEIAADVAKVSADKSKIAVTYYFKVKGSAGTRGSDEVKVPIGKQAKAVAVKVDYKKGNLSVKNGFDYAVISGSGAPTAADWITVKPQNKNDGSGEPTIATANYVPTEKKFIEGSEIYFTKDKVTGIDVYELLGDNNEATLYVRKSATIKTPVTKLGDGVKVAKTAEIVIPDKVAGKVETTTKGTSAKPAETIKTGYEYLIVKAEDVADLSAAKWTALKDKGIDMEKAKSKISKEVTRKITDDKVYILIRKQGNAKEGALPSPYIWTVISEGEPTSTSGSGSSTSGGSGSSTSGDSTSGGSTSGNTTAEAKKELVWKVVDAPEGTNSSSGETTKFKVTYDPNGGTGDAVVVDDAAAEYTLAENTFTAPENKTFAGWADKADASEESVLAAGAKVTLTGDIKYYAIWKATE